MIKSLLAIFIFISTTIFLYSHPGVGIVSDSDGNIYYTDLTHVWKISTDGYQKIAVKNVHTHELYIDEMDNLYGEHEYYKGEDIDRWSNYVWCLSADGIFEIVVPEEENLLENNRLIRDPQGNSYFAKKDYDHNRIYQETPNGKRLMFSEHNFQDVRWLHFSKMDNCLYVVDNLKIKKVTPSGEVRIVTRDLIDNQRPFNGVPDRHYIFGVTTDLEQNVYVAVFGAQKVRKIEKSGRITTVFESEADWSPCGILIDSKGSKWILEFSKNNQTRVLRIDKDGDIKTFEN